MRQSVFGPLLRRSGAASDGLPGRLAGSTSTSDGLAVVDGVMAVSMALGADALQCGDDALDGHIGGLAVDCERRVALSPTLAMSGDGEDARCAALKAGMVATSCNSQEAQICSKCCLQASGRNGSPRRLW